MPEKDAENLEDQKTHGTEAKNQDQEKPKEPERKGGESKSGGGLLGTLIKAIIDTIKDIANALFDTPGQGQSGSRESSDQQGSEAQSQWISLIVNKNTEKDPKDLDQKKVKEAGEGLKEGVNPVSSSDQSIGAKTPGQTPAQEVDDSKGMDR